jgi:hypothetical protein
MVAPVKPLPKMVLMSESMVRNVTDWAEVDDRSMTASARTLRPMIHAAL